MDDEEIVHTPRGPLAWGGQVLLYGVFAVMVGVFATWPGYSPMAPNDALIRLSFTLTSKPVSECRKRSPEELARLPPNMRAPMQCPRERSPVRVEMELDGKPVLSQVARPSGLRRDGAATVYRRLVVPAGSHKIAVRLQDDALAKGFTHSLEQTVTLAPMQIVVVDFDPATQSITIQ